MQLCIIYIKADAHMLTFLCSLLMYSTAGADAESYTALITINIYSFNHRLESTHTGMYFSGRYHTNEVKLHLSKN